MHDDSVMHRGISVSLLQYLCSGLPAETQPARALGTPSRSPLRCNHSRTEYCSGKLSLVPNRITNPSVAIDVHSIGIEQQP